jgi:hypothetical protein
VLLGAHVWFTLRTRAVQFRHFGHLFRVVLGSRGGAAGGISSFQAFCVGLASRVGTGNIAGVAIALTLGGPRGDLLDVDGCASRNGHRFRRGHSRAALYCKLPAGDLLRKAAARTREAVCTAIGELLRSYTPDECTNYLRNSGYGRA